jgi:hypothetical protein
VTSDVPTTPNEGDDNNTPNPGLHSVRILGTRRTRHGPRASTTPTYRASRAT